jgi:hypothetical protein
MPFSCSGSDNWLAGELPDEVKVNIAQMSLRRLRAAIQNEEISFPSQVPMFPCQSRADIQWRLVELYFVQNWSCHELGKRYGVTMERARQLISQWVRRAAVLGYLQEIPSIELGPEASSETMALPVASPFLRPELRPEPLRAAIAG